jgi:multisubunit Na+/H+ antiporter MnhB subunit
MNIVNFTPITAFTGGLIIGLAVVIFFLLNGRLIGISGIASNALTSKDNKLDNILFLIGLIIGPIIYSVISNQSVNITISNSLYCNDFCWFVSWCWNKNKRWMH